jgi:hypothetical protein
MLNMGTGMEKQVDVKVEEKIDLRGHLFLERNEIKLSLPMWPPVPWLPGEPAKAGTP